MLCTRSLLSLALVCTALTAQGAFVNFESPQVKPIAVFDAGGRAYVAACNTPNSSVEIYDAEAGLAFVAAFKTGLDPVSVRFNAANSRLYTTNFVGDSVSVARVEASGVAGGRLRVVLERTAWVGDEPSDIEFLGNLAVVTLNSRSAFAMLDATTLALIGGPAAWRIWLTFPLFNLSAPKALKEPRQVRVFGNTLFFLGTKGGNSATYDFDLYGFHLPTGFQTDLGGLGSTNHSMAMASDGRLFVAGTRARNDLIGEPAVAAAPTGFVQSMLFEVTGAGIPGATVRSRDLNRDELGQVVAKDRATSQPTDLALMEVGGALRKIFVTGFHSDRIAVVHPDGSPPDQWRMTHIDLPLQPTGGEHSMVGPRGLAWKPAVPGRLGARLYALNRLENSISEIDPVNERELQRVPLQHDPTPRIIRRGQRFLYSADLSGNGTVSCASCHVDAQTDSLAWNLGAPGAPNTDPIPQILIDGVTGTGLTPFFPADKGPLVTQSLQGLVNYRVNPGAQYLFTNAPYHWRGDRENFQAFNGAFVSLLGGDDVSAAGESPRGLTDDEMNQFTAFIQTVTYPPNPEQPLSRRYSGTMATPNVEDGSGAARGLELFLTRPYPGGVTAGRSCVQCHALPEGSNNRITITDGTGPQPVESAATRMLFSREARLEPGSNTLSDVITSEFGLFRTGGAQMSINRFVFAFFSPFFVGEPEKVFDIIAFLREMDSGIAPAIAGAITVDQNNAASPGIANVFAFAEGQVDLANIDFAAYARIGGVEKGYWYDLTASPPGYREEGTSTVLSTSALLAQVQRPDDVIIAHGVPVGSGPRIAALNGRPAPTSGPAPTNITLEPMRPSSAWVDVPLLTKNWDAGPGTDDFTWDGEISPGIPAPEPISLLAIRVFQDALIAKAPQFGLDTKRHDPTRRFRVAGDDIRAGAFLVLTIPITAPPSGTAFPLYMPIFPTAEVTADGRTIWESTVEAENLVYYMLMLGGPFAPDVLPTIAGNTPEPPPPAAFDPVGWNRLGVSVVNSDGTLAAGSPPFQALTIE